MAHISIRELMKSHLDSGRFTDLTPVCDGKEFKCHKVIVRSQSTFFDMACSNGSNEAIESTIHLPDTGTRHVAMMIEFLYLGKYQVKPSFRGPRYQSLQHISMYRVGKTYDTPALCEYATTMLAELVYKNEPDKFQLREKILDDFSSRAEKLLASDKDSERLIKLMQKNHSFCKDITFRYLDILWRLR
ncbi:MAG: hypothetical protein Q9194_005848 [Teloschistes cf. exilis]